MTTTKCARSTEVFWPFLCRMWVKVESKKQWKDSMKQPRSIPTINTGPMNISMKNSKSYFKSRLTALTLQSTLLHTSSTSTTHSTAIIAPKTHSEHRQSTKRFSTKFPRAVEWVTQRQQVRSVFYSYINKPYSHRTSATKNRYWTLRRTHRASSQPRIRDLVLHQ